MKRPRSRSQHRLGTVDGTLQLLPPLWQTSHVKYYVVERDGAPNDRDFAAESFEFLTCFEF